MARTFVKQGQTTGSISITDDIALTADLAVSGTLEDNLNALRTALRAAIGSPAYDGTAGTGFWHTGSANGVSLTGISTDISGTWQVNSLFVTGSGASTVSGTLSVETLIVTGSNGLTVTNGMTITGNVFEMTGSMFVSGTLAVTGAYEQTMVDDDAGSYLKLQNASQIEYFKVESYGSSLLTIISSSQLTLAADSFTVGDGAGNLVSMHGGAGTFTSFASEFSGSPSLIDAIIAVSQAASGAGGGGPVNYVSASIKGVISTASPIASGTAVNVSALSGSTACTFVTPTYSGDPAAEVDVFVNGILMSGSNYQTNEADWFWDSAVDYAEGGGTNQINFSFGLTSVDNVQVIFRKFQQV